MPTHPNPYRQGLSRNAANHVPLSPISLVDWAADVFPDRLALIHGATRLSWQQLRARARRLASALVARDIGEGDTVAVMLPNTPPDAATVAFILQHSDSKVVLVDREFSGVMTDALAIIAREGGRRPLVIDVDDPVYDGPGSAIGDLGYETLLAAGGGPTAR